MVDTARGDKRAYARAAAVHGSAAAVEKQAATVFDHLRKPEMAERHRAASRRHSELAEADSAEAARWS